jgi:hypothetical protein
MGKIQCRRLKLGRKKAVLSIARRRLTDFFRKCEHLEEFESSLASILTLQKQLFWGIPKRLKHKDEYWLFRGLQYLFRF